MTSSKRSLFFIILIGTVSIVVASGVWMIRWQNQNQIIQDLELVSNLIIQNRLVEAEEIMKERLRVSGSVPVVPWMIEAWKLRLDAAEKGNDQEKTRNLVQELLDDNSGDIIYPGDPLWIRCV